MRIIRWQSPLPPTKEHLKLIIENEGMECIEEVLQPGEHTKEHRHPFTEVRILLKGEILYNISGNQLMLRAGDRIEIPSNTRHTHISKGNEESVSICGYRPS
jgi:quercetin dioxygenase-like cupin family protein